MVAAATEIDARSTGVVAVRRTEASMRGGGGGGVGKNASKARPRELSQLRSVDRLHGRTEDGVRCTAALTCGDGACALHATWGEVRQADGAGSLWYQCEDARARLLGALPEAAEDISKGVFAQTFAECLDRQQAALVEVAMKKVGWVHAESLGGESKTLFAKLLETHKKSC